MKTLWAGVRGWVAVVRRAGAWVGGWLAGGRGVAFKKLAETLARANFFKKLRLWPDLRDFLIIRRGSIVRILILIPIRSRILILNLFLILLLFLFLFLFLILFLFRLLFLFLFLLLFVVL